MPAQIKLLERNSLSITLWNAMCRQVGAGDLIEHFNLVPDGDSTTAEVKILVNGVEVDILPELVNFIKMVDDQFEDAIEKKAEQLIMKDGALRELAMAIENAEWVIQDRISNLMKESK